MRHPNPRDGHVTGVAEVDEDIGKDNHVAVAVDTDHVNPVIVLITRDGSVSRDAIVEAEICKGRSNTVLQIQSSVARTEDLLEFLSLLAPD